MKKGLTIFFLLVALNSGAQLVVNADLSSLGQNVFLSSEFNLSTQANPNGKKQPARIAFLGTELKLGIYLADPDQRNKLLQVLPEIAGNDLFEAFQWEYQLLEKNQPGNNWAPVIALPTSSNTLQPLNLTPGQLSRLKAAHWPDSLLAHGGWVRATLKQIPNAALRLGDSVRFQLRSAPSGSLLLDVTAVHQSIKPVLTQYFFGEAIDRYYLSKPAENPLPDRIAFSDSKEKWDSMPNQGVIHLPTHAERALLLFKAVYPGDSTLEIQFANEQENLKPYTRSGHKLLFNNLQAGNSYRLNIRYAVQPENVVSYRIIIEPAWYQTSLFKWMAGLFVLALLLSLVILFYRRKLKLQRQHNNRINLELKSIRSQLNPHFVFNSLNSIQGLINTSAIDKASQYLSEFGTLMRDTLHSSKSENNNLDQELRMLDSYLHLEQLRFGFNYQLRISEKINRSALEIPVLLLQPLVENAVKHGAAQHLAAGQVTVTVTQEGADLVVAITDNGKGFQELSGRGYGLRLTRERIALLNEVNTEQPITMTIDSGNKGTTVTLTFKNWI